MARQKKDSKMICIQLEKSLYDQMILVSQEEGRTYTKIIELALQDYFQKHQNKYMPTEKKTKDC